MKGLLFAFLVFSNTQIIGQNQTDAAEVRPLNSLSINIIGDASLLSFDYTRIHIINQYFILSGKVGVGFNSELFPYCLGICEGDEFLLTFPQNITANLGKGKHFFEFGIGGTPMLGKTIRAYIPYTIVGYRIIPLRDNKINFRFFTHLLFYQGTQSVLNDNGVDIFQFVFGLSIGKSF